MSAFLRRAFDLPRCRRQIDGAASRPAGARIIGVMIESNLVAGAQKLIQGQPLVYGQSITDDRIDWAETRTLLGELAAAVRGRRSA